MLTFMPGSSERPKMTRNGFTLIELLVVIAITALMAGAVVMTVGSPTGGPNEAASRFASRIGAARDAAILGGRPVGVWVSASGYGFDRFDQGRWQPIGIKPFEGADWDRGTQIVMNGGAERSIRLRFDTVGLPEAPALVSIVQDGRSAQVGIAANGDVTVG